MTRRSSWPGPAIRYGPSSSPRPCRHGRASAASPPCCRGGTAGQVPAAARTALLASADRLLRGEWEVLGVARTDLVTPDWFRDPVTGHRSAPDRYAFRINQRSEEQVGNVKQVWEISRLQHLTLLATAWFLTGDEPYAEPGRAPAAVLVPGEPLPVRRALDQRDRGRHPADQPGLDPAPARRLARRGRPVRGRRARGAADPLAPAVPGRLPEPGLVGQQPRHRRGGRSAGGELRLPVVRGKRALAADIRAASSSANCMRNTFPSGIGRELASDYQGFVAELGLLAAVEAEAAGRPLSAASLAAALRDDRQRRRPRSTSGCGRPVRATATTAARCCSTPRCPSGGWPSLLALGDALFGRLDWWPPVTASVASTLIGALAGLPAISRAGPASGPRGSPTPG